MDNLVTGPRSPTAIIAVLCVIDAVGIHAVMALDQAHGHLVKARVVASPPPSDRWYRLLEQLERDLPDSARVSTNSYDNNAAANVSQQVCELLVYVAAFFAAETSDLEDQLALLPEDPEHKTLRARLTSIANQAGHTADALLEYAEDGAWQELLDLRDSSNIAEAVLGNAERRTTNKASANVPSLTIADTVQAQPPNVRSHIRGVIAAASALVAVSIGLGMVYLDDSERVATPIPAGVVEVRGEDIPLPTLSRRLVVPPLPAPPRLIIPPGPGISEEWTSTVETRERSNAPTSPVLRAPAGEVLGGFSNAEDLNPYCISQGFTEAHSSSGSWICLGKAGDTPGTQLASGTQPEWWPVRMVSACEWAYGAGVIVRVKQNTASNVTSWECIRRS